MAAHFQTNEPERTAWLNWFVANDKIFKEGDWSVRAVIYETLTIGRLIEEGAQSDDFDGALSALAPTVDVAVRRAELKSFLDALIERLANQRLERLRAMPVDFAKIDRIRDAIRTGLLAHGPEIFPFYGYEIYRGVSIASELRVHDFGDIDKGQLVSPAMSDASEDDPLSITVRIEREYLARDVWQEFSLRTREQHSLDISAPTVNWWRTISRTKRHVSDRGPRFLFPTSRLPKSYRLGPIFASARKSSTSSTLTACRVVAVWDTWGQSTECTSTSSMAPLIARSSARANVSEA